MGRAWKRPCQLYAAGTRFHVRTSLAPRPGLALWFGNENGDYATGNVLLTRVNFRICSYEDA